MISEFSKKILIPSSSVQGRKNVVNGTGFMQESVRRAYLAKLNMVIPSKAKRMSSRAKETRRCPVRFCHGIMEDAPDSEKMLISKAMKQYPNLGVLARSKWNDRKRDAESQGGRSSGFLAGNERLFTD